MTSLFLMLTVVSANSRHSVVMVNVTQEKPIRHAQATVNVVMVYAMLTLLDNSHKEKTVCHALLIVE